MIRVFSSVDEARGAFAPSVVTIGNFDGIHAGHRALLDRTVRLAAPMNAKPSAVTFHPHPTAIVAPHRTPKLLTTIEERCALMGEAGIEQVLVLSFTRDLASMGPEQFFRDVLLDALGARAIVVGDNFRFGHNQAGDASTLERMGAESRVAVDVVSAILERGVVVSSSEIRRLLREGRVSMAGRLLRRPYALTGSVVPGAGRGSKQVVPTLNLEVPSLDHAERAVPCEGVYVTRTYDLDAGRRWTSITNAGYRPTFGGTHLTIETFLLDPLEGDAPARIRVEFFHRLRGEHKFESAEALKAQVLSDVRRAQRWHRGALRWRSIRDQQRAGRRA